MIHWTQQDHALIPYHPALMTEGPGNHALRSERWRYIRCSDGVEELYDHKKDPWEHTNLASLPECSNVLKNHRKLLPQEEAEGTATPYLLKSPPPPGFGLPKNKAK